TLLLRLCSFSTATPPSSLSTLSLHDALPIFVVLVKRIDRHHHDLDVVHLHELPDLGDAPRIVDRRAVRGVAVQSAEMRFGDFQRSEEHTSELQSRENLVCRLLLEKKKIGNII